MAASQKNVMKRLMFDLEELNKEPVENVSASPLEENMLEWHCNIRQDDTIYHLILFFPNDYPYSSPSAEFVPTGLSYTGGATQPGKKGTKVCLNIFSDFAFIHTEWANQKGVGWSPGYTVQTVLMNVIAFLAETRSQMNLELSKSFKCSDCGHTYDEPYPAFSNNVERTKSSSVKCKGAGKSSKTKGEAKTVSDDESKQAGTPDIIDYISKESFTPRKPESREDLYGYGLVVSGPPCRPALTTPCEFLTGRSFYGMKKAVSVVHSVLKEQLSVFMPLFIHPQHGSGIKEEFEECLKEVSKILPSCNPDETPLTEIIIKTIPNLMSATVVEYSKGKQHTSDNSLSGYFALHRLFLWVLETYPDLQGHVETRLQKFIESENNRTKKECPHIGELLMLLSASQKYEWQDLADAYLSESLRRSVMWYVKDDGKLGLLNTDKSYRMSHTFNRTVVSRKLLAFQVLFLDIAIPSRMTRKDVIKRYDDNMGFPSAEMITKMKSACDKINNEMKTYSDWFQILKLPAPSEDELYTRLIECVRFAILTDGYHWSFSKGGGWVSVLKEYASMKKAHNDANSEDVSVQKGGRSRSKVTGMQSGEVPMEVDPMHGPCKGKGRGAQTASREESSARGRKRKMDEEPDEERVLKASKLVKAESQPKSLGAEVHADPNESLKF